MRALWLWVFALLAVCLVPWFFLFGLTGMIGDSADPLSITDYSFLAWIWTYPVSLLIALVLRRENALDDTSPGSTRHEHCPMAIAKNPQPTLNVAGNNRVTPAQPF